ncbi:MAG: hypothetical protein DDT22_01230 [candidate division WS2 bacterium]|nr:hypothetical protein [Candidatus Lithacetigena glycinireducens]
MKGKIRPISRQSRCPSCKEMFSYVDDSIGYICSNCFDLHGGPVKPERFYIDLWYKNKNIFICSDKTGQPLDTYERAYRLLAHVNVEIDAHTFDSSKYKKSEQKEFYVNLLLDKFCLSKIPSLAPSYQRGYKQYISIARDYFGFADIRDLRKKDVVAYKEFLESKPSWSPKTVKNILDHFKTFLRYCRDELELIDTVPFFPSVEVPEYQFKWLTRDDQIHLFKLITDYYCPLKIETAAGQGL